MTLAEISTALRALGDVIAARGGDRSAFAAAAAFLAAHDDAKPAEFLKAARKAVKRGVRMGRPTEVDAGPAAGALSALGTLFECAGAKASALKAVSDVEAFLAENETHALDAISEAVAAERAAAAARAKKKS